MLGAVATCRRAIDRLAVCAAALAASSADVAAQRIDCLPSATVDSTCVGRLERGRSEQAITVRVVGPGGVAHGAALVRFAPSRGRMTDTVVTDASGVARALWIGPSDSGEVRILAVTDVRGIAVARGIVIRPPEPPGYTLERIGQLADTTGGRYTYWYAERQLPPAVAVRIVGASATDCPGISVVFEQTSTGAQTPKASNAAWGQVLGASSCIARARWTLGKEVGEHHLRASLARDPTQAVEFTARARALPRLVAGLALDHASGYYRLSSTEQKLTVKRQTSAGEITFDSIATLSSVSRESGQWLFTPTLGLDWPPKMAWSKVRVSVAVALNGIRTDWYTGVSILQLLQGYEHEGVGADLQAVVHWSRRMVVEDPLACGSASTGCDDESRTRPVGLGVMLTLDTKLVDLLKGPFGLK